MAQKFLSDIHPTAGLKDSSGDLGSDGQVLSSTGSNTNWVNPTVGTTVIYKDAFTATNNQTAFTLANTVDSEDKTQVYIDGAYQSKGGYTVSGTTLTFDTGLVTSSAVEVMTFSTATANNAASAVKIDTFTGDGSDLTFVLDEAVVDEKVTQVYINGVYQNKSTYSIAADLVTLTFGSGNAPPNSTAIEVISFKTITSTDGTLTATTFLGDLNGTINTATTATTQSAGNNTTKIATTAFVTTASNAKVADAINNGTTGIAPSQNAVFDALALKSNIAGPTFTGTPAAPTASAGTNTTQLATTAFVTTGIANIVDSSPGALNTLNELAAALGDDANFSTTITNSIALKAPLASPTFSGNVGIGMSPSKLLDLQATDNLAIRLYNSTTFKAGIEVVTTNGDMIAASAVNDLAIRSQSNMLFSTGGNTERLRITSGGVATFSGDVKVNEVNPLIFVDSTSTNKASGLITSESGTNKWAVGTNFGSSDNSFNIYNYAAASRYLTISSGGDATFSKSIKFVDSAAFAGAASIRQQSNALILTGGSSGFFFNDDTNAVSNLAIASNGNATFSGSIALGGATIANSYLLEITAASGNIMRSTRGSSQFSIYQANNGGVFLGTTGNNDLRFIQNDGDALIIDTNKNVGIGNTNPSNYSADANNLVVGSLSGNNGITILSTPSSGFGSLYFADGTTVNKVNSGYIRYQQNASIMSFGVNAAEAMRITLGRVLQIFGTSTANALSIAHDSGNNATMSIPFLNVNQDLKIINSSAGVLLDYAATSWTSNSDENIKENITSLDNVLDKIKDIRCVNYNLKDEDIYKKRLGFIAQDFQEDFEEVVNENSEGILGLRYTETIPILMKAIQEQQTIIEDLKSRIETLEG